MKTIRNNFLEHAFNKKDLCHEIDVYRVCTDDWTVNRFLFDNKDQKKAEKALIKAMHWRMEFGVNDMTDDYFPRELYQRGDPQLFGQNRQGKYIVWGGIRNKNEPFIDEMMDLNKRWMVYLNEQCDKFVRDKGYTY